MPQPVTPLTLLIRGHNTAVFCASFSPDGNYIVSGSSDVRVWDAQTGKLVLGPLEIDQSSRFYCSVIFSPNGRRIAAGTDKGVILVWDAATGEILVGPIRGHTIDIYSVNFSPDGRKIVSGGRDSTVRIWDAQAGINILGPLSLPGVIYSAVFSSDGKRIAVGGDFGVDIRDAKTGLPIHTLRQSLSHSVTFSPSGREVISCLARNGVCVWNATTGALVTQSSTQHAEGAIITGSNPQSGLCTVAPDGKWIADTSRTGVNVRDSKTGLLAATYEGHTSYVCSVAFSPDSKRVLTASFDQTIRVHTLDC